MQTLPVAAIVAAAVLTLGSAAARAEEGFYLGGAFGSAQQNYDTRIFDAHGSPTGYKFELGVRPLPLLAAEVSYVDFGRAFNGINYVNTNAVGVFGLAYLPIPVIDVFGKVGLAEWRTNAQSPFVGGFHRNGADVAYGLGGGTSFGPVAVRLEYERYTVSHSNDMGMASIGVIWTFL